ncbi:MAG: glutamine synthetase family protein [Actinomycetes bacterium]|jgi:glutamine synthetase|uniref:Unannotated protein n=1 Tax=freshwater metagenome TaxID=449393 RepID=A0A6J6F419_9ZZZZ|nr:hypothetical protein [Actinomycetota bacterium]
MSSPRLDEIAGLIAHHGVHTVELATIDTYGHLRGKRVPAQRFVRTVAEHGAHIADAIYVMDPQCEIVDSPLINMGTGFLDMHLEADLETFRLLRHRPGYATVMSHAIDHHHRPHPLDPRNVLQAQIDRVRALGYDPIAATELECYICHDDWTPAQSNVQYSSLIDNFPLERCVADMRNALLDLDIPVESSNPEYGPGQLEINFGCSDPMRTADNTVLFKATVKEIARNHGYRATFMPKPYAGQSGNGMHVHTSLNRDGHNVFDRGEGHLLNDVFRHWVGGLIHHARAISLLGIPLGNGYKRVRSYSFCPTHVHWGGDNRSVLCRCTVGQGSANRVEFRAAGADANPYLIIGAILAAGADGLERHLDPGPEATGDQYDDPGEHPLLPATFAEGVAAFETSALAAALGEDFTANFMALTRYELDLYEANASGDPDDVTAWEFARYVEFS